MNRRSPWVGLSAVALALAGFVCAATAWADGNTPASAPAVRKGIEYGPKAGQLFDLAGRAALVQVADGLPFVDNEFTRKFVWDRYGNPKLEKLRVENRLDEAIARGRDEMDKQLLLMDWVYAQIEYGDPLVLGKTRNAQDVLDLSRKEQKLFCTQFSTLLVSASASLGWVCRPIGIPTHSFNEMWSNQHRRWVLFDPTANWYAEKDGVPQNMYEVRKEWFENKGKGLVFLRGKDRLKVGGRSFDAYYILNYICNTDWLDRRPSGSLVTKDQFSGGRGPTQNIMPNPAVDPYFPINQAALSLTPDGANLKVTLKTLTPNFKTFRVRLDGKEWADSDASFTWELHEGVNTLEAKSQNLFGLEGPLSRVELAVGSPAALKGLPIVIPGRDFSAEGGGKAKVSDRDEEMPPGYVHHWYTKGQWLEWNIPDAEAGDYDLTLTYSTRYHTKRGLAVNGEPVKGIESFEVAPTGSWGNFSRAKVPGKVALKAGSNVLRLTCQDDSSMCLSKLTLSMGQPGKKDIVIDAVTAANEGGPAPAAPRPGQASPVFPTDGKVERIYAPRGGFFRMWSDKGHALEYTVEAPDAGEYQMYLRYGEMYPSKIELKVNGDAAKGLESFTMPINGGWQEWVEKPVPAKIALKRGRNTLRLTQLGGQGLNMSDIRLARAGKADLFINASSFTKQEGGTVMNHGLSRHGFVYGWGTKGHWLEYTVNCPIAGEYEMVLRRANARPAVREVRVNGQAPAGLEKVTLAPTGGGQAWQETVLPTKVTLAAGKNTIRLTNVSGSTSLDEIQLRPAK